LDKFLDCETQESTYRSLSNLFSCSKEDLMSLLGSINLDEIYSAPQNSPNIALNDYVLQEAINIFKVNPVPEYVYWFHTTRTIPDNKFENGILPLGNSLEIIWQTLFEIFKDTNHFSNIVKLKSNGVMNFMYKEKSSQSSSWGPFAILVKEIAFKAKEIGAWDYLCMPEIIDDICNEYKNTFGLSIYEDVSKSLKPCIIKFKSSHGINKVYVRSALYYLYACIHNVKLSLDTNACFDANNNKIPLEDIMKIEFIDHGETKNY
jgi:hypothetical protein